MKTSDLKLSTIDKQGIDLAKINKNQILQNKEINPAQNLKLTKQQQKQIQKQDGNKKQINMFEQYLNYLKRKVLRRKIILFIFNIILTLVTIIFCLFFLIWENVSESQQLETKIQQVFSTQFSIFTLGCIILIGVLSTIFSIIIINGKVIMLHCYWISCLLFLIIFSVVSASAFSMVDMDCEQPSSYILQKLKSTNQQASRIFCSDICPCQQNLGQGNNVTKYGSIKDCPEWNEVVYSSFFQSLQQTLKCSGWCNVNQKSYYTFYNGQQQPSLNDHISCFHSIQNKIQSDTSYFRIFSLILCLILVLVIFYTNYYIFMEKQDQNRQAKKLKKKIQQTQQIMEDQLRTSKRMLS